MKAIRLAASAVAIATLAGCVCGGKARCCDPVMGNWSATFPYETMSAGSFIFSRNADGTPAALVLHRWGSPEECLDVKVDGNAFSLRHPYGVVIEGEVAGCRMFGRIAKYDVKAKKPSGSWQPFSGYRNPPVAENGPRTDDATLGESVDILADGLDGFEPMFGAESMPTWSFKDGVLSNRITGPDGKRIHGTNIRTKRGDFYDFNLEYDVRVPKDCNSGMYLRGRIEIQTLDSYGKPRDRHSMAAYYGRVAPSVSAEKAPGEWQHVSATIYKRRLTVELNGVRVIDNAPVTGVTGGAIDSDMFAAGPLYIQGDHSDADYRNIVLRPAL